jgi:hypothetical protein
MAVKLQEVLSGIDQPPFRLHGGSASSLEAIDPAVVLLISEHRLDHPRPFSIEPAAGLVGEHGSHPRVGAGGSAGASAFALVGIGRDKHLHPAADDLLGL